MVHNRTSRSESRRRCSNDGLLQITRIIGCKEDRRAERPAEPVPVTTTTIIRCERHILRPIIQETKRVEQHVLSPSGSENRVVQNAKHMRSRNLACVVLLLSTVLLRNDERLKAPSASNAQHKVHQKLDAPMKSRLRTTELRGVVIASW